MLREEIERINFIHKKCNEIQKKYNFLIPKYILSYIANENYDKQNLSMLINMAVINDRFTEKEGKLLKTHYCLM